MTSVDSRRGPDRRAGRSRATTRGEDTAGRPLVAVPVGPWGRADRLRDRVRPPRFPNRFLDVTEFGAVGDGERDCTAAFRAAIRLCAQAGGGHVVVPAGRFLTGPIHLLSNVNLHVSDEAVLAFSRDPAAYLPAVRGRWGGLDLVGPSPLVYAHRQRNIGLSGGGVLDGGADERHWWPWTGLPEHGWRPGDPSESAARERLRSLAERGVRVSERLFGASDALRPQFIQPYRCRNVVIDGITVLNPPMAAVNPVSCENVLVQHVTVRATGPDGVGCAVESSRRVRVRGCDLDASERALAVLGGQGEDGRHPDVPSSEVLVEGCALRGAREAAVVGAGAQQVFLSGLRVSGSRTDTALRVRGGSRAGRTVGEVHVRDLDVDTVDGTVVRVVADEGGTGWSRGARPAVVGVGVDGLTVERARRWLELRGRSDAPVRRVVLRDIDARRVDEPAVVADAEDLHWEEVRENGVPVAGAAPPCPVPGPRRA
ncbi:glycoside hydrolase family 28 protein [Actinoalloteichus spitiensis]|uniref:glycoside hydrolase family 28 protein n=1 Tax=Actinoalloteichus spitiensis TaxID=252394 RepID=UPI0003742C80|nr:glycosyl hydrolase family 28-related protein [Actinoalloteichus spitiensis]